jgi:hypothetical protein
VAARGDDFIYRRLPPSHWDPKTGRIETSAFRLRPNESTLSVYRADRQTPRGVLLDCLKEQERKLQSEDEAVRARAEAFFQTYGTTVESLVANRWRVACLPVSALTERGFRLDEPDRRGHQDVHGTQERFRETSRELRALAVVLSPEECSA